ncbi:MAG: DUF2262 domain-containing protein [Anaerolineae bacterium]
MSGSDIISTRKHDRFGTLTLNTQRHQMEALTPWAGQAIKLFLDATVDPDLGLALQGAEQLWDDQEAWNQRILDFCVQALLNTANTAWLEDDEPALTPGDFKSRIKLLSIQIGTAGEFSFVYDDGQIFLGHAVVVTGNVSSGPKRADLWG